MKRRTMALLAVVLLTTARASAGGPIIVVADTDGAAARVGSPVCFEVDLAAAFDAAPNPEHLQLVECEKRGQESFSGTAPGVLGRKDSRPLFAAQFVPEPKGSTKGTLWWLMTPGAKGQRRFELVVGEKPIAPSLAANLDRKRKAVDVAEGDLPVLRYNHGTVPPPSEIVEHFEKNKKPPFYYARGDYIHPVYGPDGEPLTDDYSMNHPHHRGICWAWPVVRWQGESRDIWAVRVLPTEPGGIWARPVSIDRIEAGPVLAIIEAQNVWKWADRDPIVEEHVAIRTFRQQDGRRFIDIEIRLLALVDDLSIGGRPKAGYGGFTFRTFPEFDQRKIEMRIDPSTASPRRAWFHLTGNFPGGQGPAGMALFEHVTNPDYPSYPNPQTSDGVAGSYPRWRTVQPAWPGDREVALAKGKPLVLKHRLWIHPGLSNDKVLSDLWTTYANPPSTSLEHN